MCVTKHKDSEKQWFSLIHTICVFVNVYSGPPLSYICFSYCLRTIPQLSSNTILRNGMFTYLYFIVTFIQVVTVMIISSKVANL